jgi:hypothetical protein
MEYVWIWGLLLAIAIIVFYKPNLEKMTNKDLLATLRTFGTKDKTPSLTPNEEPIYGPKVPKLEEPAPASSNGGEDGTNMYPDIYGPEITPIPGALNRNKSKSKSKTNVKPAGHHASDDIEDEDTYKFNPDLAKAFPMEENEPQPFLADFSKFQH